MQTLQLLFGFCLLKTLSTFWIMPEDWSTWSWEVQRIIAFYWLKQINETGKALSVGALLDPYHGLTSYAPFRGESYKKLGFEYIDMNPNGSYTSRKREVDCAVRVIDTPAKDEAYIGNGGFSPVHDLYLVAFEKVPIFPKRFAHITKLPIALGNDTMKVNITYQGIGMQSKYDFDLNVHLLNYIFKDVNAVVVNCDDYIPRYWGYFICILNTKNSYVVASGASLYSNGKLFGVGSFLYSRYKDRSILVFTDVRPYRERILNLTKWCKGKNEP